MDKVGNALRVGIRGEYIALCGEFAAQGFVVFDNAVVHDGNAAGDVRVGIALGGHAVRRPAGVGNAGNGAGAGRGGFKFGDATGRTDALDCAAANDR